MRQFRRQGATDHPRVPPHRYQDGGQRHLPDGVIVTEGNQIVHVGPAGSYTGAADETVDPTGRLVTPA